MSEQTWLRWPIGAVPAGAPAGAVRVTGIPVTDAQAVRGRPDDWPAVSMGVPLTPRRTSA